MCIIEFLWNKKCIGGIRISERAARNRKRHFQRIFKSAERDPNILDVIYPGTEKYPWDYETICGGKGYKISRYPLRSYGYVDCNGVAILIKNYCALNHYNLKMGCPEKHLESLIEEIKIKYSIDNAVAALVGGNKMHADINRSVLRKNNILIIGEYIDGCGNPFDMPHEERMFFKKDVLVVPLREMIVVRLHLKADLFDEAAALDYAFIVFQRGKSPRRFL